MYEDLLEILIDLHPEVDYEVEDKLWDNHIFDSLDVISLVSEISAELDIAIPAEELTPENFNSAQALAALLERLEEE